MSLARAEALALHGARFFLTEKNRRIFDACGSFTEFARLLLANRYDSLVAQASATLRTTAADGILSLHDDDYPALLKEIDYAPFILQLCGDRTLLQGNMVSIVGTREPSAAGREAAHSLSRHFAAQNGIVVSGMARGVDGIAHRAALDSGGSSIAVLANGFDHLYPLENRDLYARAASGRLLLVSEYEKHIKPQRHHFIRRNRIIAGLSPLTIFVEGAEKSGGMITVRHALDAGRDVAALSHAALTNNAGGEKLIGDGAIDITALAFS